MKGTHEREILKNFGKIKRLIDKLAIDIEMDSRPDSDLNAGFFQGLTSSLENSLAHIKDEYEERLKANWSGNDE